MTKSSSENTLSFIDKLEALWIKKKFYYDIDRYKSGIIRFKIGQDTRNYSIKYKNKPHTAPEYLAYVEGIKEMMEQLRGNPVTRKYNGYNFAIFSEYGDNPLTDIMKLKPTGADLLNLYKRLFFGNLNVLDFLMKHFNKEWAVYLFEQGHDYLHDNEYEERQSNAALINFLNILINHGCTSEEILKSLEIHLQNSPGFNPDINKNSFKQALLPILKNNDLYKEVILMIYKEDNIVTNLYNKIHDSLILEINTEPMMTEYGFGSVDEVFAALVTIIHYCNHNPALSKINQALDNQVNFGYFFSKSENTHSVIIKGKKDLNESQIKELFHLFFTFCYQYRPVFKVNLNWSNEAKISDEIRIHFDRLILAFSLNQSLPEHEEEDANISKI